MECSQYLKYIGKELINIQLRLSQNYMMQNKRQSPSGGSGKRKMRQLKNLNPNQQSISSGESPQQFQTKTSQQQKTILLPGSAESADYFGDEIEDQYYKRSVPSILSPKRNNEQQPLSIKSPKSGGISAGNKFPFDAYGDEEEEEIDIDDEAVQFAQLSVEDDESGNDVYQQHDVDREAFLKEMADADIEMDVEDEDGDQFNEDDFRRFQEQMVEQSDADDDEEIDPMNNNNLVTNGATNVLTQMDQADDEDMLRFLESEQMMDDDLDDYGIKVSPSKRLKSVGGGSNQQLSLERRLEPTNVVYQHNNGPFPEQDQNQRQLMHTENIDPQVSDAQPIEMMETNQTMDKAPSAILLDLDNSPQLQNDSQRVSIPSLNFALAQPNSVIGGNLNNRHKKPQKSPSAPIQFQAPPIQIKSFVKVEGQLPQKQSINEQLQSNIANQPGEKSTSMLQQTPLESPEHLAVASGAETQVNNEDPKAVKVSQFTEQSKSKNTDSTVGERRDHRPIRNFEFEQELMNNDNNNSQNSLNYQSSTKKQNQLRTNQDLNVDIDMSDNDGQIRFVEGLNDLNQVQKLTSQTLLRGGPLAQTTLQSDFNETKGAELALRDLLKSSCSPPRSNNISLQLDGQQSIKNSKQSSNNKILFVHHSKSISRCSRSPQAQQDSNGKNHIMNNENSNNSCSQHKLDSVRLPLDLIQEVKVDRMQHLRDCGPEGHDTPESMNHYSCEGAEDSNKQKIRSPNSKMIIISSGQQQSQEIKQKKTSLVVPLLQLEQNLLPSKNTNFTNKDNSGIIISARSSSIKPSEPSERMNQQSPAVFQDMGEDANRRAFLEDQDVDLNEFRLQKQQQSSSQQPEDGLLWTGEETEFKTNINFEFKNRFTGGPDSDAGSNNDINNNNGAISGSSPLMSDDNRLGDDENEDDSSMRFQQHMHTQQEVHMKSPSGGAHQYEDVAIESELGIGNPSNPKSKTSLGFNNNHNKNMLRKNPKRPQEATAIVLDQKLADRQSKSRVDQKRSMDTKLSIVRRNAEKLKQKRKEVTYKQSSAATRTKSVTNNSVTGINISTSANSSKPRPLNISRLQTSQKVLTKDLDRAPLPLSKPATGANRTSKPKATTITTTSKQNQNQHKYHQPDQVLKGSRSSIQSVARPKIPQQALMNANKSMKQIRTNTSKANTSSLPAAMQKMTIQKRPQAHGVTSSTFVKSRDSSQTIIRHGIGSGAMGQGSLSQTTFDYNNGNNGQAQKDQNNDTKSFKSMKANVLATNSINTGAAKHHHLLTSAKIKGKPDKEDMDAYYNPDSVRQQPNRLSKYNQPQFDMISTSQATNNQSLQKLQEKYRRGSPRVMDHNNYNAAQHHNQPLQNFKSHSSKLTTSTAGPKQIQKPSMTSVFERKQQQTSINTSVNLKPPRSSADVHCRQQQMVPQYSAAEVREKTLLENQEQVLRVQLSKIESKLDQKRREVSQSSNRKTFHTPSVVESRQGSNLIPSANKNTSFVSVRHQKQQIENQSQKSEARQTSSNQKQYRTNSVAESISKYKRKRMESFGEVQKKQHQTSQLVKKQEELLIIQQQRQKPEVEEEKKEADQRSIIQIEEEKKEQSTTSPQLKKLNKTITILDKKDGINTAFESPRLSQNTSQHNANNLQDSSTGGRASRHGGTQKSSSATNKRMQAQRIRSSDKQQPLRSPLRQSQVQVPNSTVIFQSHQAIVNPTEETKMDREEEEKESVINTKASRVALNDKSEECPFSITEHADQKETEEAAFESMINDANNSSMVGMVRNTQGGYQALRQKNTKVLKNGEKFQSLQSYMEKYRGPHPTDEPAQLGTAEQNNSCITMNNESDAYSPTYRQTKKKTVNTKSSPDFSQVLNRVKNNNNYNDKQISHEKLDKRLEATFKPRSSANRSIDYEIIDRTSPSKKDEKKESYNSPYYNYQKNSPTKSNRKQQNCQSPKTSLTPVLKNSSVTQKFRKESTKKHQQNSGGRGDKAASRTFRTYSNRESGEKKPQTSMFRTTEPPSAENEIKQSSGGFYKSNLFKKLTEQSSHAILHPQKSQKATATMIINDSKSDILSQYSRPISQNYNNFAANNITSIVIGNSSTTDNHFDNISGSNLSQAAVQPQVYSRLNRSNDGNRTTANLKPKNGGGAFGKPPKMSLMKKKTNKHNITERHFSNPNMTNISNNNTNMKAVDYIEETQDYEQVIHELKDILENPRQYKPLGASSTSNISYHTIRTKNVKLDQTENASPRSSQGQQQYNLKHKNLQHKTINQGRDESLSEIYSTISPPRSGKNRGNNNRSTIQPTSLHQPHVLRYPSQTSFAAATQQTLDSGVGSRAAVGSSRHGSIRLLSGQPGKIIRNSTSQASNNSGYVSLASQLGTLSKADQRRKEHFDKSLQSEVQAIEKVIRHRQTSQGKSLQHPGSSLQSTKMVNNYVDSLKQPYDQRSQSIVTLEAKATKRLSSKRSPNPMTQINMRQQNDQSYNYPGNLEMSAKETQISQNHISSTSQTAITTEEKTQMLMRQIQQLQPMVLQAQSKNRQAQDQINELMGIHTDMQRLEDSQVGSRQKQYGNIHQMLESSKILALAQQKQSSSDHALENQESNTIFVATNDNEEDDELASEDYGVEQDQNQQQFYDY